MTGAISIFLVAPKLALSLTHGGAPLARAASTPPALRTTEGCAAAVSQSVARACRSSRVLARKCSECVAAGGEISHVSSNPTGMFAALTTRSWSLPNVKTLLGGSSSSSPSKDSRLTRLNLRPGVGSIGGSGNARESPPSFRHATRGKPTSSPSLPVPIILPRACISPCTLLYCAAWLTSSLMDSALVRMALWNLRTCEGVFSPLSS